MPDQPGHIGQVGLDRGDFSLNAGGIASLGHDLQADIHDFVLMRDGSVEGFHKRRLDILVPQRRHFAIGFPAVLVIATPSTSAYVFLASVKAATFGTEEFPGEAVGVGRIEAQRCAPLEFLLGGIKQGRGDDGGVAVFHIILRHLALVNLVFLGQEIRTESLLEQRLAFVFFVVEDVADGIIAPFGPAGGRGNAAPGQVPGDPAEGFPLHEEPVDIAHALGLLVDDLELAVLALPVAEEPLIGHVDHPLCKAAAHAPGDIFRNAPALLLGEAAHDGNEQFTLGIQREDVLLFKIHLYAALLQLADGGQRIHGVAGKAADGFCDDQVNPPLHGSGDHGVEAVPVADAGAGDALVRVALLSGTIFKVELCAKPFL